MPIPKEGEEEWDGTGGGEKRRMGGNASDFLKTAIHTFLGGGIVTLA